MRKLDKNIKAILAEMNMSQRQLAERTGITEVSISRYVSGRRVPKVLEIIKIAEALNTTPNKLLGIEEHKVTNADRIRNMKDEELAEFIYDVSNNAIEITVCKEECAKCNCSDGHCISKISEWLQKEARE